MADRVDLNGIIYGDDTGYATHVRIELDQYLPYKCGEHAGNVRTAAFSLPVRNGEAVLACPGAEQVFRLTVQPVISRSPNETVPLGAPCIVTAPGGVFYDWAVLQTIGELVERTILEEAVLSTPGTNIPLPSELTFETRLPGERILEVGGLRFDYHDEDNGGGPVLEVRTDRAAFVDFFVEGVKSGANGWWPFRNVKPSTGSRTFSIDAHDIQDITRVDIQPYRAKNEIYGNAITLTPSAGLYLVSSVAEAVHLGEGTVNRVAHSMERAPSTVGSILGGVLTPAPRDSRGLTQRGAGRKVKKS